MASRRQHAGARREDASGAAKYEKQVGNIAVFDVVSCVYLRVDLQNILSVAVNVIIFVSNGCSYCCCWLYFSLFALETFWRKLICTQVLAGVCLRKAMK